MSRRSTDRKLLVPRGTTARRRAAARGRPIDRRAFLRSTLQGGGAVLLTTGVGGTLLAACDVAEERGEGAGEGAGDGGGTLSGTLDVRMVDDIRNLDPAFLPGTVDDAVMLCVAENLLTYPPDDAEDPDELVHELAEEFESSEDGLTHEFRLKEGIPFHGDYGEVTAQDVKFSFERIAGVANDVDATFAADWAALEVVEVTGEYEGVIRLSEPFPPLMNSTIPGHAGMVVSQAAWEELGEDIGTQPIGSGPYRFVEWERGQHVLLERFEDWGGAALDWAEQEPAWEQIRFQPISDDSSADIAIESREIEFGPVDHASVDRFEDDDAFEIRPQPTMDYAWIAMNVTDSALQDVNVRRAIRRALDVDAMIEAAFEGRVERAHALISPEVPLGHWQDAPRYDQDLDEARSLLEEAGIGEGELSLEMTAIEEPGAETIAQIVQANLGEIGIEVDIRNRGTEEAREQIEQLQLTYLSFSMNPDPSWATEWFTSGQVGEWNYMSWSNEEFDRLHEEALVETDQDARHDMYVRMQQLMDEEAVAAWVMYRTHHYAFPNELETSLVTNRYGKYRAWHHRSA